jgi:hypothetical protein
VKVGWLRILALLVGLAVAVGASHAESPTLLPPDIPSSERARLLEVADAATVVAHVQAPPFPARREVFEYLLDHPEFATHVTRALKLGRYRIWRASDGLWLDDGWGARGRFRVVHAGDGIRVMHARGVYEQRFLPDISGEAVVLIEYAWQATGQGRTEVRPAISGFVKIDNRMLAAAGRFANSIATAKAEKEAKGLAKLFARTTRAIEEDPGRVWDLIRARPDVPRRELEEFGRLVMGVGSHHTAPR